MDTTLKQQWVEALRSGEYQQGKGYLYTPEAGYCCLGVLCEIHPDVYLDDAGLAHYPTDDTKLTSDIGVPDPLAEELGLLETPLESDAFGDTVHSYLTHLNDGYTNVHNEEVPSRSFSEIADWIEENL